MKNLLKADVKWFILIIILSVALWSFVFGTVTAPKDTEKLFLFVTAENCNKDFFKDAITSATDVKQATVVNFSYSDGRYSDYFQAQGLLSADLIILKTEQLQDKAMTTAFAPLDEDILKKYGIPAENLVRYEETAYAITVFDPEEAINVFGDKITFADGGRYCIGVNVTSKNADESNFDNAWKALAALLKQTD